MKYKFKKGDIVCVWMGKIYINSFKSAAVLQGFGKVISIGKSFKESDDGLNNIKLRWIKIKKKKYRTKEKNKYIYNFIKERCTLLIKAKDTTGQEDWRSLLALAKLKL